MKGIGSKNAASQEHEAFVVNQPSWFLKYREYFLNLILHGIHGLLIARHQTGHYSVEINELSSEPLVFRVIDLTNQLELQFQTSSRFHLFYQMLRIFKKSDPSKEYDRIPRNLREDGTHSKDGH